MLIGVLCCMGLIGLLAIRVPIAIAMMVSGLAGLWALIGWETALSLLEAAPFDVARRYSFTMIPLFLLMGQLAAQAGLAADLFAASRRLLRRSPAGIPLSALSACGAFSAVSGSSLATAATMGRVAIPDMMRFGVSAPLAAGTIAAGGTLGIMVPPSIALLLYALITEQSVGALFMAGIVPGVIAFLLYALTISLWIGRRPPVTPENQEEELTRQQAMLRLLPALVMFITVMGGLYGGWFTPTEAAGAGAFLALLLALYRGVRWQGIRSAIVSTLRASGMIFLIIIGAEIFGYVLSVSQIAFGLVDGLRSLDLAPWAVLLMILGFFLICGLFMDSLAIILITVPIVFPLVQELGIDPIWFGILAVVAIEIGLVTPPVGMNLFVIRSVAPGVALQDVVQGILPFVGADLIRLALLLMFPVLSLWLPGLAGLG